MGKSLEENTAETICDEVIQAYEDGLEDEEIAAIVVHLLEDYKEMVGGVS